MTLEDLRAASRDGRLLFVGAERAMGGQPRYSTREVGERVGAAPEFLVALRRAHGLPVARPRRRRLLRHRRRGGQDRRAVPGGGDRRGAAARRSCASSGRGMAQTAEAHAHARSSSSCSSPALSEAELDAPLRRARRRLHADDRPDARVHGPPAPAPVGAHRGHQRRRARRRARCRARATSTVCFADLVGFTRLGEQVAPDELGRVAQRLVELAAERLRGDVRLVKTIGDAAMLVGPDADAMLELALDLVDAADAEGEDFPQLRVGDRRRRRRSAAPATGTGGR